MNKIQTHLNLLLADTTVFAGLPPNVIDSAPYIFGSADRLSTPANWVADRTKGFLLQGVSVPQWSVAGAGPGNSTALLLLGACVLSPPAGYTSVLTAMLCVRNATINPTGFVDAYPVCLTGSFAYVLAKAFAGEDNIPVQVDAIQNRVVTASAFVYNSANRVSFDTNANGTVRTHTCRT